jgi:hypothetical protein
MSSMAARISHVPERVGFSARLAPTTPRETPQKGIVPAHQRFFLRPRPAFELAFGSDRILDAIELLMKDELTGPRSAV